MTAFATYTDLAVRLNRTFTAPEQAWVTALLEDGAALIRGVAQGNQIYPSTTSTYTAYPKGGRVGLPQTFIRSVTSVVTLNGVTIRWQLVSDVLYVTCDEPVKVTFTYGMDTPPADLIGINCALAAQVMLTVQAGLGLTAGGLSSVAIDDFKAAFADGGKGTGMSLTDESRQYIIDHYGVSAWTVEATR